MNVLPQHSQLIWRTLGHDEVLAVQTNEQRHSAYPEPLRPLVRARAGELEERSPQVRKLSHEGRAEPNARTQGGG